jgi:hypothetical protein
MTRYQVEFVARGNHYIEVDADSEQGAIDAAWAAFKTHSPPDDPWDAYETTNLDEEDGEDEE